MYDRPLFKGAAVYVNRSEHQNTSFMEDVYARGIDDTYR